MSNPVQSMMVAVANGKIRSGDKDLIPGEIIEAFYSWPMRIQKLHLSNRKVVMMPLEKAQQTQLRAVEIRARSQVKEEMAELAGMEAQLKALQEMLDALDEQREGLLKKGHALNELLKEKRVEVNGKLADPDLRPEDSETAALEHHIENEVEANIGVKQTAETSEDKADDESSPSSPSGGGESSVDPSHVGIVEAWANALTYKQLRAAAKELKLKSVGVTHAELMEMVVKAKLEQTEDEAE
jgi:hypothetical protein